MEEFISDIKFPLISSIFKPYQNFGNLSLNAINSKEKFYKNKNLKIFNSNQHIQETTKKAEIKNKLFSHHNYGYKCYCMKTNCKRKYCLCYNEGRYCVDCFCKDCENQLPKNSVSNIKSIMKKTVICTCTKSECNKNYCECFKNGEKCTNLCRCVKCQNCDEVNKIKKGQKFVDVCPAISIYIISNNCIVEDLNDTKRKKIGFLNKKKKNNHS